MDLTAFPLAWIGTAIGGALGSAAFGWLCRAAKRHLRLSVDLRFRIRTNDDGSG